MRLFKTLLLISLLSLTGLAQGGTGNLRGQVFDQNGAILANVAVTATLNGGNGVAKSANTNAGGEFAINNLPIGTYTVSVNVPNFAPYENAEVAVAAGQANELTVTLSVAIADEEVIVSNEGRVNTEPDNNADQTVLKDKDLESLPEDPDELAAALQALAGSAAGPNGGQFFIDGFSGGRLPPREAIREIRINANPFSAEFDRLGFGRVEILTKPGIDKFRGQVFFNFGDESLNSRNAFAPSRVSSQIRNYGGNVSGALVKGKSSYFVDFSRRETDDNAVIRARTLDAGLNIVDFNSAIVQPSRRISFSPRFDFAINDRNTLIARYNYEKVDLDNQGLSELTLPSLAFATKRDEQEIQLTETAILSPTVVNETRFRFEREKRRNEGDNSIPTINAAQDFTGGGANVGLSYNNQDSLELQNYTSFSYGKQAFKAGARFRYNKISDFSESNFGGRFLFQGIPFLRDANGNRIGPELRLVDGTVVTQNLSAIEQYRQRVLGNTDLRFNPSQFSITTGEPLSDISQSDIGIFITDDWRVRPDLTLSFGLRYENQSNISSNYNFAPRFGFAYSPGAGGARQPKTVFRGGFGIFYERFGENLTLNAIRFDGSRQRQFVISDVATPGIAQSLLSQAVFTATGVTNVPTAAQLSNVAPQTSNIRRVDEDLQSPVTYQGIFSVERQLPLKINLSATYIFAQTENALRSRNINAPDCAPLQPCPASLARPNRIDIYESTGTLRQNLLNVNVNSRLNPNFTVFSNYRYGSFRGDTDGSGSFPAFSYDTSDEFGRTAFDIRHSFVIGGSYTAPFKIRFNPFIIANSGRPFNITTGTDDNRDFIFNDRPTFAALNRRCQTLNSTASFCDIDGIANPETTIIPRNYGNSPAYFNVNLGVNKTFGFGGSGSQTAQNQTGQPQPTPGGGIPGVGGPGGGNRGGGGGGGRGGQQFGTGGSERPYNLTVGLQFTNLLNRTNVAAPIGNLASSRFGQSIGSLGGFGGFGGFGGGGGGGNLGNRRVELQMRFSF